jgi:G3E family GTPase
VLVNEFGQVPIDQATMRALGGEGMQIAEVAGGCLCCTAGVNLQSAMTRLIGNASPSRILIEPTGLGHPDRIRDMLSGPSFRELIRPAATLCLIDPRQFVNPRFEHLLTYWEQVKCADVVVVNKTDLADEAVLRACRDKLADDYPDKAHRVEVEQGRLSQQWLNARSDSSGPGPSSLHRDHPPHDHGHPPVDLLDGRARRQESAGLGRFGCGWVFEPDIQFDHDAIAGWLSAPDGDTGSAPPREDQRLKGILHTDRGWWVFNAVGAEATWQEVPASSDSRIECISASGRLDWLLAEKRLLDCICLHP